MVDQKIDQETIDVTHAVENALASLWDKAREASYLISTLRDEKRKLQIQVNDLQEELVAIRNDLLSKQSQLEEVRSELTNHAGNGSLTLTVDEKRELQRKISSIISKLDQYIAP